MSEARVQAGAMTREGEAQLEQTLERVWAEEPGLRGWLATVDHKRVGIRYIATAVIWFALAGALAMLMRLQLSRPDNDLIGPDAYGQIFTTHGTAMMFLFAVPVMTAFAIYLVPLMVGTRNIAFPRLNAYGYWVFLFGGTFLFISLLLNSGPEAGWFNYVPLSGPEYSPGKRTDVWAQTVTFTEIAALVAAVEVIVTAFKFRAPGMSIHRMPILVWAMVVISFMILFAMTTVALGSAFLASDRLIGTHLFNPAEGGDPLLWQHLFWYFGHPEVYIMFLPGLAILSHIVATFSGRSIIGYPAIVLAIVAQGILSFGLWVHHMFATGLPQLGQSFFTATSMIIAIPTGVQIFCWIATMWSGKVRLTTPMLFVFGFLFVFVIGGMTGVMIASVPFDLQAHDTYFIVAHFHYVLIGGVVFPFVAALYYWFPKFSGRLLSEKLGRINFALLFIGTNVTFFPMHWLGLDGMTRRIYTYSEASGWGDLNLLATIGSWIIATGVVTLVVNILWSLLKGERAGPNPWNAGTLEWDAVSPPRPYGALHIPVVQSREPLWSRTPDEPVVSGLEDEKREALITSLLDATPQLRQKHPGPTVAPLMAGVATAATFITVIFTPWGLVVGGMVLLPALIVWGWPRGGKENLLRERAHD
jgi:cytochrome c oxidase subunit I+III